MKDIITKEKLAKYKTLTSRALDMAKKSVMKGKQRGVSEIINMVSNYLSDAEYFEQKGDFINAFAALNYAHGWLDSGVRLGIFKVKDSRLFTIK